jgi:hypothetical protein
MNTTFLIGIAVGAIAVGVYFKAHQMVRKTADQIDRRTRHPLAGFCADCGGGELTRSGVCATCQSNAVWCPTPLALPALGPKVSAKHAALAAKTRRRFSKDVTVSQEVN